jgi:hypothetical protein
MRQSLTNRFWKEEWASGEGFFTDEKAEETTRLGIRKSSPSVMKLLFIFRIAVTPKNIYTHFF